MGLAKFAARKGAVGGTARWVADCFFGAYANNIFDIENCSTKDGLEREIDKIVQFSLAVRFESKPHHSHVEAIYEFFNTGDENGLLEFTIAILAVEAGYYQNTTNNMIMFDEVITEELRKKHVGEAVIFGRVVG